jgi:hypothetical protein
VTFIKLLYFNAQLQYTSNVDSPEVEERRHYYYYYYYGGRNKSPTNTNSNVHSFQQQSQSEGLDQAFDCLNFSSIVVGAVTQVEDETKDSY